MIRVPDSGKNEGMEAVLFPGFHVSEGNLKRVLSFFETVSVPVPWEAEGPSFLTGEGGPVRVVYPPQDLKPAEGFRSLLSEYKAWAASNPDKGYALFLQADRERGSRESSTWEIRQAIRRGGGGGGPSETAEKTTRWHLVLHLANETWETQREANRALRAVKEMGSPLAPAMEEVDPGGLMGDLPEFETDPGTDEGFLERVFDAWLGLFGGSLDENAGLVTTSRSVMRCLSDLWDEYCVEAGSPDISLRFRWPDFSHHDPEELGRMRGRFLEDRRYGKFIEQVQALKPDSAEPSDRLAAVSERLNSSLLSRDTGGTLLFTLKHFALPSGGGLVRKKGFLKGFSGKTLFLVEEAGAP